MKNNLGFDFTEEEILKALQDLESYSLTMNVLLERYSLDFPKTRFVMFNDQLVGIKVVLHHAYFLKHGKANPENPVTDRYESILRGVVSSKWEIIHTED